MGWSLCNQKSRKLKKIKFFQALFYMIINSILLFLLKDTCNSVALSLNLHQRTHPIIWPVEKLPSDCLKCLAVPSPIGGILLFAVNSLIYLNQSVPSYGVSLNSISRTTSSYPFKNMESSKITLDCSHCVFVTPDRLILSLKGGEIYILTLLTDSESLRSIRSFNIEKGPPSVIASSLTKCCENFLFVGSRLGNSILIKYTPKIVKLTNEFVKDNQMSRAINDTEESSESSSESYFSKENLNEININDDDNNEDSLPPNGKKAKKSTLINEEELEYQVNKMEEINDNLQKNELDFILDYTENHSDNKNGISSSIDTIVSYTFDTCDMLLNIAPCGDSIIGESCGDYNDFDPDTLQYHIDLITSSGQAKNGAISVLQRSLRPDIILTFQIEQSQIIDMWSVQSDNSTENSVSFLFLTSSNSTIILQMTNEITDLDVPFCTKQPTLYCGNLNNNKYIAQIVITFIYVYSDCNEDNSKIKIALSFDLSSQLDGNIKAANINDPYIAILTDLNTLYVYELSHDKKTLNPVINEVTTLKNVKSFSFYFDEGSIIKTVIQSSEKTTNITNKTAASIQIQQKTFENKNDISKKDEKSIEIENNNLDVEIDDEDEFLYGTSTTTTTTTSTKTADSIDKQLNNKKMNELNGANFFDKIYGENENVDNDTDDNIRNQTNQNEYNKNVLLNNKLVCLLTTTNDGQLNIYSLNNNNNNNNNNKDEEEAEEKEDNCKLLLIAPKFNTAPKTLIFNKHFDENFDIPTSSNVFYQQQQQQLNNEQNHANNIHEILMIDNGSQKTRPLLIASMDEDLIIYEAFIYKTMSGSISLHLKRVNHQMIIRERRNQRRKAAAQMRNNVKANNSSTLNEHINEPMTAETINDPAATKTTASSLIDTFSIIDTNQRTKQTPIFRKFSNIAGFPGFMVTGSNPYMVFQCPRSGITAHPIWLDGSIVSFTPLKNTNICPSLSGFIYLNNKLNIRICSLPSEDCNGRLQIYYDSSWISRKIQLRQTVHFIVYHEESKTYAVVTSISEPTNKIVQLKGGEDKEEEEFEKDSNFILPQKSQFFIQLYTPTTWEALPLGRHELSDWEHVSCLKIVNLPFEGHSSGFRSYLAASTINCYNEDVNSRGKIFIFDVIETVPEPDKPLTNIKMKIIFEKEQKGPVSCLESVNGYLIGGVGQKVFIWEYINNELIGKAFIDTHFFVHRMVALKNFVLIADLHRSISLIHFQKDYTKLSFVAKVKTIKLLIYLLKNQ
jgi:hypothetical protein